MNGLYRVRLVIGLAVSLVPALAVAQSPFLRSTDTRTSTPETLLSSRESWGADFNFGATLNRGNVDFTSLAFGLGVVKKWQRSALSLAGSALYNTFGSKQVFNQGTATLRYDRWLSENWRLFAFNSHAYNDFILLNYRATVGAGPWYDLKLGPTVHGLSLAGTYEYESFQGGVTDSAGRLSFRLASKIPVSPIAELDLDFFYVPRASDLDDYHLYAQVSLETLFVKSLFGLKVSWIDEYDSRPQPGIKTNDQLFLASLTCHVGK